MQFRLSPHALEEIVRRQLPVKVIHEVVTHPEQKVPEKEGRTAYQSRVDFGGKIFLVRVIVAGTDNPATVVTAYRTAQIAKYWSKT